MTIETATVAESNNFIILETHHKIEQSTTYQTEQQLEEEFITDLQNQGYEYLPNVNTSEKLLANFRNQLEWLNAIKFSDQEWERFLREYANNPNDGLLEKTTKIHYDWRHDFIFDSGEVKNINLLDKRNILRNRLQVINQVVQTGTAKNRYDVTILVNGLPLVQVELKRRGEHIREAFNQMHRYRKESFNAENSLYKYLQIFVMSNGTDTRYFANTTKQNKLSFDFTINWATSKNLLIKDLKDFTATFFQKNTILKVLLNYSVFDSNQNLLIMRPYQIAATERILWKIQHTHLTNNWNKPESGGFIWHTTGSGKTLTSFKTAQLAMELDFIDKVLFVVDRKDLDHHTIQEYKRFSERKYSEKKEESVVNSENTLGLKKNLANTDKKIIVTTIQKLNNLVKSENHLPIYKKAVVFIFDECHRSQFGEAQRNIKRKFKKFCQFGFTGTPILLDNAYRKEEITEAVFGKVLHAYVIADAIRDEKVLKFKVDYNNVRPKFKHLENEQNKDKLTNLESIQAFQHPERIQEISRYILRNFNFKTHRSHNKGQGFNALFAVSNIDSAKLYYNCFKKLQQNSESPLMVATVFSFSANETPSAIGEIADESFDISALNSNAKDFLQMAIADYNAHFKTNFSADDVKSFDNYYKDLSKRIKDRQVDLTIVVGMLLTGFDAPCLNTLFVDKNLSYHGLLQAYSRTNRILDRTKTFGNIVTFRNLEQETKDAITLFSSADGISRDKITGVVIERPFNDYLNGYLDPTTGNYKPGYIDIVESLQNQFPNPDLIETEKDKRAFIKLFSAYLRIENILQNYDEFTALKELKKLNAQDVNSVQEICGSYNIKDEQLTKLQALPVITERQNQDYRSTYNDIMDQWRSKKEAEKEGKSNNTVEDSEEIEFEIELLKSQEINLDYILELLFEHYKKQQNKDALIGEMHRLIRSSLNNRAKESLVEAFIQQTDLTKIDNKADIIKAFYQFAQEELKREAAELIQQENLNKKAAEHYITTSLKREYASLQGADLTATLPQMNRFNPQYLGLKERVFRKVSDFVEKFKGIGQEL